MCNRTGYLQMPFNWAFANPCIRLAWFCATSKKITVHSFRRILNSDKFDLCLIIVKILSPFTFVFLNCLAVYIKKLKPGSFNTFLPLTSSFTKICKKFIQILILMTTLVWVVIWHDNNERTGRITIKVSKISKSSTIFEHVYLSICIS